MPKTVLWSRVAIPWKYSITLVVVADINVPFLRVVFDCASLQALHSLQLVFELREMGFQEKVIHAALKEAKNKRDDAVDYLISHT